MRKRDVYKEKGNYIEIDLKNLQQNINFLKTIIDPKTKVIAMVKSNAYGHGIVPVSSFLQKVGIDFFGVFTVREGILLRTSRIRKDILIFGPFQEYDLAHITKFRLTPVVGSRDEINFLVSASKKKAVKIHIKIDTGMGRIGFLPEEGFEIISSIKRNNPSLILEGICTHFADSSSKDPSYTVYQASLFLQLLNRLEKENIWIPVIHASNSAAILRFPQFQFNCVRPGILIYGIESMPYQNDLKPVMSLYSYVSILKTIPENSFISYTCSFKTNRKTLIAIVPIGYADGYMLDLSNKAYVLIKGKRFPIIGNICMNQFIVDITDSEGIKLNDKVTLIGKDAQEEINVNSLAKLAGKIPYEIICRLSENIPRINLS